MKVESSFESVQKETLKESKFSLRNQTLELQSAYNKLSQHQVMVDGTIQFLLQRVDQLTQIVQDLQKESEGK